MTRKNKETGSSAYNEDGNAEKWNQDGHSDSKLIQFVKPPKRKREKNSETVTTCDKIGGEERTSSSDKKKLRFNIGGEVIQPDQDAQASGNESAKKKKIRKPRWSEERKIEERKRKVDEPLTDVDKSHQPKKKKKKATKKKIRTADQSTSSSSLGISAIQYLQHWQYDRTSWKFSKVKQTWLLRNIFDLKKIPSSIFPVLVKYISTIRGGARLKTYKAAEKVIKDLEEKASTEAPEYNEEKEIEKCLEGEESEEDKKEIHHRARSIMQTLSDCI